MSQILLAGASHRGGRLGPPGGHAGRQDAKVRTGVERASRRRFRRAADGAPNQRAGQGPSYSRVTRDPVPTSRSVTGARKVAFDTRQYRTDRTVIATTGSKLRLSNTGNS